MTRRNVEIKQKMEARKVREASPEVFGPLSLSETLLTSLVYSRRGPANLRIRIASTLILSASLLLSTQSEQLLLTTSFHVLQKRFVARNGSRPLFLEKLGKIRFHGVGIAESTNIGASNRARSLPSRRVNPARNPPGDPPPCLEYPRSSPTSLS